MHSKETIYQTLVNILEELFEIDPSQVTSDSQLYDDLDIDSIDAVDLVVKLKDFTGRKINAADFKQVRSVGDIVDAIYNLQGAASNDEASDHPDLREGSL